MCKTIYKIASFILIVTVTINSTVQYAHPSQGSSLRPVATGMKRDSVSPALETAKLSSAGKSDISGLEDTGWGDDQRLVDIIRQKGLSPKPVVLKANKRNAEGERSWIESRSSSELIIHTTSGKFENMLEDMRPKLSQKAKIASKRRATILPVLILISVGILAMFYFVFRQPIRRTVMRLKNNIAKVITNLGYLGRARAEIRAKLEQILIGLVYPEGEESMKPLLDAFDTLLSEIDSTIGIDNLKEALHSQDLKRRRDIVKELYALIAHKGYLNNLKPKPLIRNLVSRLDGQDIFELLEEPNLPKEVRESRQSMRNTITACTPLSQMAYVILSLFGAEMKGATAPGHSFAVVDLTPRYKLFVDFSTGLVDLTDMPRYYVERDGYLMLTNYAPPSDRALQLKNRFVQDEITRDALLKLNLTNDELFYVMYSKIKITDSYGFTPQIYVNTCHVYFKLGMHDKAIAAGKKAVALDSNLAEARYRLALVYYEIGRYDEAIAELLQATRLDPGFSSNHQLLGLAYAGKRAFTKAEAAYKEAIRVHAQSAKAHYNLANMYDKQTRHNEALKEYELAVQHDPYMAKAYFQLGRSYFRMGISSKSLENWAKAVKLDPKLLDKLPEQLRLIIKPAAEKMRNFPPSSSVKSPDSAFLMPSAPESAATKASSSGTSDNALSQEEVFYRNIVQEAADFIIGHREALKEEDLHVSCEGILLEVKRRLKREGMLRRGQPINAEVFVWIEERDYHTYLVVIEGGYILDYELVDPEDLSQGGRPIVLPFASAEENIYRGKHWRQILDPKDQSFLWNILQNEDRWNDVAQRLENEDRTAPGGHATESEDPGRSASAGRESEPKLHLEWKTIIAAPIIAGLIVTPLFIAGVIPVSFAYFFAFIDIAITAFSVWMHEKGYLKGRKNAFDGLAQEAKARLLQNQRLSLRAFALGLLLFSPMLIYIPIYLSAPSFATTIPLWFMSLTENLAYISVLCGMAAVINFLLWFLPAFSGKEGLIAGELMSEEEEKDLIGEIKKLYREDGEVVAAIDKAVAEGVDIQARLYKGEPIWIYGMAKRYNAEEDRLVNDADSMRMEFHDKPLVVETEDDPMSRYHYISSESQLAAEIEDENSRAYELDMGTRQKGERRFHIYRLEDQKEETAEKQRASLLETVPRVKGIASVRRGTMDVDGKHHRGIIVDVVSSKDEDMHLRVDEILGENPRDLFIERSNAENRLMRYALNYLFALRSLLFEWIMFLNDVALGVRKEWLKKDTRLVYRIVRVMFVLLSELSKGKHDNRILVRKRNVNDYTLECLYDHHKIAEDEDWVVLEKEKRSKIPVNMEKYKAFRNIVKNSRLYKNMIISDFSSAAISGVLLAILLPAILETAQGFGVLAIGLLAITALTNITLIFGFLWSGTRIRTMEEPLSKIETVKARGGGIGDAIKQQVNIRLRRYHGAWGVLVILVSRILYLLLYPLFFIYLWHIWPAAPLGLIITLFLSMYIIWQVIEPIAVSFDWSNVFLIGEHGTGRSHFSDVRKKGLAEKFWRAEAFRSNLINIITLLTLLVTLLLKHKLPMIDIAITENLKVAVVDSWLFWAIFIPIGIILRPGLRILTLLYGEDSDSKLIIHSDPNNTVKKIAYFASENRYEYRFKFEDCGITLRSENPYFRPERIRDYRLKNLYGIPLRIAEVLDKFIPSRLISRKKVSFTERVQKGFFRVEEPYVIVDPDRLGIRMELDNAVKLVSPIEGEKHPSWMPVKKSWRFDDNGTTRAEIRQYAFDGHIDINSEDNRVGISSEKAKEDEELHRRNVVKFVDGKLIQEAKDNPLIDMGEEQGRRTRTHAVNTLLKGGVVYIHGDPVVYNSQRGNIHSDLEGHRKDLEERPLFIPNSPPEALRKYSFDLLGVRIEDGVREETFAVYHYVKPEEIPDEGYVEGVRVDDSMIRVSYYKSRIPGRIRKARIAKVERIKASSAGEKIELPIERTIRDYDVDIILIEQGLAAEGAEEALPGFSKAADNSVTEYLSADSKDKGFDSFKRAKLSTLDRVLLWRTAQRAPDQEAKNLKYAETASMLYQLAYGILLVVVGLVFSRMGELDFEALNISQFITSPLLILTTVMFLPWISERIDKIAKMQVSQRASQKSRGDLGIDRRYTSFNILKRQMGWAAIIILFSGLLFTFQLTPLFSGFTLLFGISPGVAFVFLQLAFVYTISVHSTIEDKTWWKLLEDLVRNNPRLIRKGYQRWFFDYLGTGVKIVFSCLVVSIVFFFFYYSFGLINSAFTIITAEFGTTTLGYILAAIALPVFSLSHFIFPLYARFGGDSKLVLEEPDSNFIIKKEEWKKSTNGSNGNGKTFIRRLFKFSSGRTISTTNPRSLPFLSESESDRYTKRFVMLDPDKQGVTLHGGGIETFNSRVNAIRGFFIRLFSPIKRLRIYKNRRGKLILYDYRETEKPSAKSPIRKGAEDNAATGESKPIEDAKPSSAGHTESEPKANVVLPMSPELLSNALFPDVAEKIGESLRPTSDKGGLPGDEELFQDDAGDLVLQRAAPLRSSVRHIVAIDNAA